MVVFVIVVLFRLRRSPRLQGGSGVWFSTFVPPDESVRTGRGHPLHSSAGHGEPRTLLVDARSLAGLLHLIDQLPKAIKEPLDPRPVLQTLLDRLHLPQFSRMHPERCNLQEDQTEKQWIGTKDSSGSKSCAAHRCVTDPPHPYTLGKCDTCNAAESGTKKTTVFSAGPLYTPKRGQSQQSKNVSLIFENIN